jgi:hypothetical protein
MQLKKLFRSLTILLIIFSMFLSGWPALFSTPGIPPQVSKVYAASPSVLSRSTGTANAASITVTLSGTPANGNLYIIFLQAGSTTTTWTQTAGTTGWSELYDTNGGSVWYKQIATNEPNPTFSLSVSENSGYSVLQITGHENPSTQAPQVSIAAVHNNSSSPNPPSLTPTGGAKDYLWLAVSGNTDGRRTVNSGPTNYSNLNSFTTSGGPSGASGATAERSINASSEDPGAFTLSGNSPWEARTIAIHPQSASSAPNAPSQDSPTNGATAVSTSPIFQMSATDSDSDNLSYKVTVYSDNACTNVVQTNDQSISSTGWSGTDATCTNSPTSCYASGTNASFQTQTPLSANTQYWWKSSAKDPDGTGTFTDSSTCNSFTTLLISISVSDGVINYGTVPLNSSVNTTSSGINDTQVLTNDGSGPEDFNIRGQNSTGWTLAATAGVDEYVHQFCTSGSGTPDPCDTGATWNALTTSYQTLATAVAASSTRKTDFRLIMPTTTSTYSQQDVDITVQAVAN